MKGEYFCENCGLPWSTALKECPVCGYEIIEINKAKTLSED